MFGCNVEYGKCALINSIIKTNARCHLYYMGADHHCSPFRRKHDPGVVVGVKPFNIILTSTHNPSGRHESIKLAHLLRMLTRNLIANHSFIRERARGSECTRRKSFVALNEVSTFESFIPAQSIRRGTRKKLSAKIVGGGGDGATRVPNTNELCAPDVATAAAQKCRLETWSLQPPPPSPPTPPSLSKTATCISRAHIEYNTSTAFIILNRSARVVVVVAGIVGIQFRLYGLAMFRCGNIDTM